MSKQKSKPLGWCAAALVASLLPGAATTQPAPMLHVGGDVPTPKDWTVADLSTQLKAEIKPVVYTGHSGKHTFGCVPLLSVLKASGLATELNMGAKADPKTKNYALRFAIVTKGRDGYITVFSIAELLPDIGNREAWVALDEDGKPLPEADGPVRLLVPSDAMPARSVHELDELTVVNLAK